MVFKGGSTPPGKQLKEQWFNLFSLKVYHFHTYWKHYKNSDNIQYIKCLKDSSVPSSGISSGIISHGCQTSAYARDATGNGLPRAHFWTTGLKSIRLRKKHVRMMNWAMLGLRKGNSKFYLICSSVVLFGLYSSSVGRTSDFGSEGQPFESVLYNKRHHHPQRHECVWITRMVNII